ncbi:GntR family transcriptional regulator [Frigoribacterium sp. PvP032]|uniref:GntR family transcriptional regulator n=1 Tax=Frigoribacterium sp. PvP032 TaxID=2806589 RepID=UPI001AE85CC4|nr:GntR family transcriptional regulator [Frigoribacterium sp. PvP032]MBP1189114.1 DNA-binding transcriptional regulator YhcF (GntR family) [Frigoribacterium sp. PvP032]
MNEPAPGPAPVLAPVVDERRLLSEDAFRVLRDAVLDGTLEPGERLHDDELVAWLGVSRTPIRSALDRLRCTGLVELSANRFTRVRDPDGSWLAESASAVSSLHRAAAEGVLPGLGPRCLEATVSALGAVRPVVRRASGRPVTVALLCCLGLAVGGLAARSPGDVVASALDVAELRLAHGLRSRRCVVELTVWDDFAASAGAALAERDACAWGDAVSRLTSRVVATARAGRPGPGRPVVPSRAAPTQ